MIYTNRTDGMAVSRFTVPHKLQTNQPADNYPKNAATKVFIIICAKLLLGCLILLPPDTGRAQENDSQHEFKTWTFDGKENAPKNDFQHEFKTWVTPWTKKPLYDAQDNFHFAIISDRTGGVRPDVFEEAIKEVNLLQPDFVICIGDLIQGYTNDRPELLKEWKNLNSLVQQLDMRFFYTPGNHDIAPGSCISMYPETRKIWGELLGPAYYHFVYKNVLFLILHSHETAEDSLGQQQVDWAIKVLNQHPDVRETFVFMHYPLWEFPKDKDVERFFKELSKRNHTVFAGHLHQYRKSERNNQRYIRLATTGGLIASGAEYGTFDHFMWVSVVGDRRPILANVMLNGVKDEDIFTEEMEKLIRNISSDRNKIVYNNKNFYLPITIKNPGKTSLKYKVKFSGNDNWSFSTPAFSGEIAPGGEATLPVKGRAETIIPVPAAQCEFAITGRSKFKSQIPTSLFLIDNFISTVPYIMEPPVIDGKLDDKCWQVPVYGTFRNYADLNISKAETKTWLAYDKNFLYWAVKCYEPDKSKIVAQANADSPLWDNDYIELFLDTDYDLKNDYHIRINPKNVIYGECRNNKKFNVAVKSAVNFDADGWTMEMAIPWKDLNISQLQDKNMGILFSRNRPNRDGVSQLPVTGQGSPSPKKFGTLKLLPSIIDASAHQ